MSSLNQHTCVSGVKLPGCCRSGTGPGSRGPTKCSSASRQTAGQGRAGCCRSRGTWAHPSPGQIQTCTDKTEGVTKTFWSIDLLLVCVIDSSCRCWAEWQLFEELSMTSSSWDVDWLNQRTPIHLTLPDHLNWFIYLWGVYALAHIIGTYQDGGISLAEVLPDGVVCGHQDGVIVLM